MEYLLKASAVIAIFYLCYHLFLQRETFFQTNRLFLITGVIVALFLPFIVIPVVVEYEPVMIAVEAVNPTVNGINANTTSNESYVDWIALLKSIYIIGVIIFSIRCCIQLLSVARIISKGKTENLTGFKLIKVKENIAPFSFFKWIVINADQFNNDEIEQVLIHEKAHASEYHSIDVIFLQIATIIFWFNPFIWFYNKALKQNLEFIADKSTKLKSQCLKSYQTLLLKNSIPNYNMVLANNFYNSLLKKRIVMLNKHQSRKWNQLKLLFVLPILGCFIMSFNTKTIYVEKPLYVGTLKRPPIEVVISNDFNTDELNAIKDQLKAQDITMHIKTINRNAIGLISSIDIDFKSINGNTNYNAQRDNGIKPFYFKMNENGSYSISSISEEPHLNYDTDNYTQTTSEVDITENIEAPTDEEVVGEVEVHGHDSSVPENHIPRSYKYATLNTNNKLVDTITTTPGNVLQNIYVVADNISVEQISDDLLITESESIDVVIDEYISGNNTFKVKRSSSPLIILNGKDIGNVPTYNIDYDNVENMNVIKGEEAVINYGQRAKNGVIIINTNDRSLSTKAKIHTANYVGRVISDTNDLQLADHKPKETNNVKTLALITKHTSDIELDQQIITLKTLGLNAKISKVKRNKRNEIIKIKVSVKDKKGNQSSSTFMNDNGIKDINYIKSDGFVFIN